MGRLYFTKRRQREPRPPLGGKPKHKSKRHEHHPIGSSAGGRHKGPHPKPSGSGHHSGGHRSTSSGSKRSSGGHKGIGKPSRGIYGSGLARPPKHRKTITQIDPRWSNYHMSADGLSYYEGEDTPDILYAMELEDYILHTQHAPRGPRLRGVLAESGTNSAAGGSWSVRHRSTIPLTPPSAHRSP